MQRYLFRIGIAVIAFFLSIGATLLWVTLRAPGIHDLAVPAQQTALIAVTQSRVGDESHADSLQGRVLSMPQPTYPPRAKAARAQGAVTVLVEVTDFGAVASAKAVSGHPLLRDAAVRAAYQARFSPSQLGGSLGASSGYLTYNFALQ